jgi:hypothetical protein
VSIFEFSYFKLVGTLRPNSFANSLKFGLGKDNDIVDPIKLNLLA